MESYNVFDKTMKSGGHWAKKNYAMKWINLDIAR